MDLTPFGFSKRRDVAIVIGAGATRGASFTTPWTLQKPPLDVDFFRVLRSSPLASHPDAERLLAFVSREFGTLDVRMETFYSQAYLHNQFIGDFSQGKGRRRDYQWSLTYFLRTLPRLFAVSLSGKSCEHHETLVSTLSPTDTLVSFNYDCLLDRALATHGGRKWDPGKGYGFPIGGDLTAWMNHAGKGRYPKQSIRLLKPHGSFNWKSATGGGFELLPDEYARLDKDKLLIVPPLWQKSFDQDPYPQVWLEARRVLSSIRALLVIGYSIPETDVYTQALLRMDIGDLEFFCAVNPDPAARVRVMNALRSAISIGTYVVELDRLEDLARVVGSSMGVVK